MGTIREYLEACKVDWDSVKIVIQSGKGWDTGSNGRFVKITDPILDIEFASGYGAPECPRYVAQDKEKTYFPWQYDGATGGMSVYRKLKAYIGDEHESPYPGG